MKYIIASDIHGSLYYTKMLQDAIISNDPDKIILLGDLYYHGPRNPLPKDYNPMAVCDILNMFYDKIIWTKGNCDAEVDEMISKFKVQEIYQTIINNKHITFCHGHKNNIDNPTDDDVLIYGHFHTGYIKQKNNKIFINTGSISIPKEQTPNSYIIIDDNTINLINLTTNNIITSIVIN